MKTSADELQRPNRDPATSKPEDEMVVPKAGALEIERKFLVNSDALPDLNEITSSKIRQGYLSRPEDGTEVRLRQRNDRFYLTIKHDSAGSGGVERVEREVEVSEEQFNILWPGTEGRRIEKTRYEIKQSGYVIELDIFGGSLEGLLIAEVEFSSRAQADAFAAPEWFMREVTDDKRYRNKALALRKPD